MVRLSTGFMAESDARVLNRDALELIEGHIPFYTKFGAPRWAIYESGDILQALTGRTKWRGCVM